MRYPDMRMGRGGFEYDRRAMVSVHRLAVDLLPRAGARVGSTRRHLLTRGALLAAVGLLIATAGAARLAPADAQEQLHEGRPLAAWTGDLTRGDGTVRRRAALALPAFGAAAVEPLGQAVLSDVDPEVRLDAVKALGALGKVAEPAVPTLAKAMQDRVNFVRRGAAAALGSVGAARPEALDALMHGLVDPDPAVIDNAAHGLLALGAPSVGPLTRALSDPDVGLRQMAVLTLSAGIRFGKLRPIGAETVTALIDTLADANSDIRDEAARALADLGPQAKNALPALRRMASDDPTDSVRLVARRAIDRIEAGP